MPRRQVARRGGTAGEVMKLAKALAPILLKTGFQQFNKSSRPRSNAASSSSSGINHQQFGGKALRPYRKGASGKTKKSARLTALTGVGNKTYVNFLAQDTIKHITLIDKKRFSLLEVTNGANGIGTFHTLETLLPKVQTAFSSSTDDDARVVVKNEQSTILFKNQSNVQAKVQLLVVECIRDVPDEESNLNVMIGKGFLDYGMDDSESHSQALTLAECPRFWKYFKVRNSKMFYLDPGAQREKTIKNNWPRVYTEAYKKTTSYVELKGALRFMLVCQGTLIHDATTDTNIGYSPITMDISFLHRAQCTVGNVVAPSAVFSQAGYTAPVSGKAFVNAQADEEVIEV